MQLPYLELPLCIGYGTQADENTPDKLVNAKISPSMITAYHEGYYPEVGTFIYHGTHVFQVAISVSELERQLIAYWDMLNKKQTVKDKLKIIN